MPDNRLKPHNTAAGAAAGAYDKHAQTHATDQRDLEARVLLKSARFLQDLHDNWETANSENVAETLKYNRQIWMMFYDTALENKDGGEDGRPDDLRSNIINLANFIFKRETEILAKPDKEKLEILISINHDIAAGLMTKQQNEEAQAAAQAKQEETPPPTGGSTDISS